MMTAMSEPAPHPLDQILAEVILEEGGTCQAADVRAEIGVCLEEIREEQAARGERVGVICHFYVTGGVAIFTIVAESLDIYVVSCPKTRQWELVNRFERLARSDSEGYRRVLATRYGKERPDLLIEPALAIGWLYGDEPTPAELAAQEAARPAFHEPTAEPVADDAAPPAAEGETVETAADDGYQGDPMLEQMMAAIRAAGGGKGSKPIRPQDL